MKRFYSGVLLVAALLWFLPALAFQVEVAEAPGTNLQLTLKAISGARKTLLLNIYELTSPDIADAIIARVKAGVHVELIVEGQPVGGLSPAGKGIEASIAQAMRQAGNADRILEMYRAPGTKGRFGFDHAKYAVIDGQRLLIGSENYSPSGHPAAGAVGNRGWEVLISDAAISAEYAKIFSRDSDTSFGDLVDLLKTPNPEGSSQRFLEEDADSDPLKVEAALPPSRGRLPVLSASQVTRVTAPDSSLSGLVQLIRSARKSIDIQQMSFDSAWAGAKRSPLVDEIIKAAKRGVKVRVLLNDEAVFTHPGSPPPQKNLTTVKLFNQAAAAGKLPMQALTANLAAMGVSYIHNKGVLVDGTKTLISSINWGANSILNNREAAVLIESPQVNAHYQALFDSDWSKSAASTGSGSSGTTIRDFED